MEHDVKEYPDAGHSFMNRSSVPGWMKPMVGSLHSGYVDTAADDAWDRIQAAFDKALRRHGLTAGTAQPADPLATQRTCDPSTTAFHAPGAHPASGSTTSVSSARCTGRAPYAGS